MPIQLTGEKHTKTKTSISSLFYVLGAVATSNFNIGSPKEHKQFIFDHPTCHCSCAILHIHGKVSYIGPCLFHTLLAFTESQHNRHFYWSALYGIQHV